MELLGMDILDITVRLLLGACIGFSIGLTGIGGGVLVLPALTLILGLNPIMAVGTTSLYSFLIKIYATLHHLKLKTIDWGTVLRFLAGAIPANIAMSLWISSQGGNEEFQRDLKTFIVGVVFFSVIFMIINLVSKIKSVESKERSLADYVNGHVLLRNGLSILLGAMVGALMGATSIGGGVLIIPIFMILFGLPTRITVGSSIFFTLILTFANSLIYGKGGETDNMTAVIMALGSVVGVYYGSKLSVKMHDTLLKIIVIAVILAAGILMLGGNGQ